MYFNGQLLVLLEVRGKWIGQPRFQTNNFQRMRNLERDYTILGLAPSISDQLKGYMTEQHHPVSPIILIKRIDQNWLILPCLIYLSIQHYSFVIWSLLLSLRILESRQTPTYLALKTRTMETGDNPFRVLPWLRNLVRPAILPASWLPPEYQNQSKYILVIRIY